MGWIYALTNNYMLFNALIEIYYIILHDKAWGLALRFCNFSIKKIWGVPTSDFLYCRNCVTFFFYHTGDGLLIFQFGIQKLLKYFVKSMLVLHLCPCLFVQPEDSIKPLLLCWMELLFFFSTINGEGSNTLGKRSGNPLRSFSVPAPPQSAPTTPQPKHIGKAKHRFQQL